MEKRVDMQAFVGEEEVMKMNAELASRNDFTVEDIENLPEGVRADLIIEIASKSTIKRDYGIKMLKYRTAGVREYWIVDPMKETVMVYWFEDEEQNLLYGFQDEIEFHMFPGLKVRLEEK